MQPATTVHTLLCVAVAATTLMTTVQGLPSSSGPALGDADQLQADVNAAIARGDKELVVHGDYQLGNKTLLIEGATGLTIRSETDSTLWNWGYNGAVRIKDSTDVTFKGFILDRNPTPYIRGAVTGISGKSFVYTVPEDSLTELPDYWSVGADAVNAPIVWYFGGDAESDKPKCQGSFDSSSIVALGNRTFQYPTSSRCKLAVGDNFVATVWLGYSYGVANSTRVTTQDVAIRSTPIPPD